MPAPAEVVELVSRFERNREAYLSQGYNEAQLRREFVDPLFKALGWDMDNVQGYAEAYKDVIHEDAIKIGGATKAPDYCFRIGGTRKFFLETKRPGVGIGDDASSAFQLRRYGWSAKLPLSVLTNFAELAVYDCRVKPDKNHRASVARVKHLAFSEYVVRWDELAVVFSREAVLKGVFDKFAWSRGEMAGTAEVDAAFLEDIEAWRELLARNFALRNPDLSQRELNQAVQLTIDRIVFLRICEDRGIETYGRLLALANAKGLYRRLFEYFGRADDRYNSGLFHFHQDKERTTDPDILTPRLAIDDEPLRNILRCLYYPESPYEFSVLPAVILGQVYEQFLGKVIRLTAGHRAVVEEKQEVRKAGGVYYTPAYIVDYIVRQTLGRLLEGKTPRQARELRILDPACGSGSFLLGAYQYLLDWHLQWYATHDPRKHARGKTPAVYEASGGDWRLTTGERKRVLLSNVYGVDIDPQAVEVTKLSLLLKVLEGASSETIERQFELFHERALPDLGSNIRCGNSLIAPELYNNHQLSLFDQEERLRINAFAWRKEFSDILERGGFHGVIGNPPWGADVHDAEKPYLRSHYRLNSGKFESYIMFVERAAGLLDREGVLGMIIPSYWISRSQTEALRTYLCGTLWPSDLVILPENVFPKVKMDCCVLVASRTKGREVRVGEVEKSQLAAISNADALLARCRAMKLSHWERHPFVRFNPRVTSSDIPVIRKIEAASIRLGEIVEITQGLTLYRRSTLAEAFGRKRAEEIVRERLFHCDHRKDATFKKELLGRDVSRFHVKWNGKSWVSYGHWLAHAVDARFFKGPRLVIQKIRNPMLAQRLVVGYLDDEETYSAGVLLNAISNGQSPYHLYYLMGILNSKAINYWYRKCVLDVSIRVVDLARVPIRPIDFANRKERSQHDRMVGLAEEMMGLQGRLSTLRSQHERVVARRLNDTVDRQIDQLVYELYGVGRGDIRKIEEAQGDSR